jgi:hypothetical protein
MVTREFSLGERFGLRKMSPLMKREMLKPWLVWEPDPLKPFEKPWCQWMRYQYPERWRDIMKSQATVGHSKVILK